MCGVFGFLNTKNGSSPDRRWELIDQLFLLSEARGKESSGLSLETHDQSFIIKQPTPARKLLRGSQFKELRKEVGNKIVEQGVRFVGHSRLVTNGPQFNNRNNQPFFQAPYSIVHNGIVTNDRELFSKYNLSSETELDTEVIGKLFDLFVTEGMEEEEALRKVFSQLEGTASLGIISSKFDKLIIGTNNGSLYYSIVPNEGLVVFASEAYILEKSIHQTLGQKVEVHKAPNGEVFEFKPETPKVQKFTNKTIHKYLLPEDLERCSRCVLPVTFPSIDLDEEGVCRLCRQHERPQLKGKTQLLEQLEKFRKPGDQPEAIVAFSGGRDSCYGLHYLVKELGVKPIIFTYDWGMVTDLARRNTARMAQKLGVEHIIVSPDIAQKRRNIRKNVNAWMHNPHLGMIPLFMAGDKQFYYHAERLKTQLGIDLLFFCDGNRYEKTDFKTGFAGIEEGKTEGTLFNISIFNKLKMIGFYAAQFLGNPKYLNSSLADTAFAFYCSYFLKKEYMHLYHYVPWEEKHIVDTLVSEYNWEKAKDTTATWRIGDGTASIYNFIYYTVAGFSEHDTFRSNQVRAAALTRDRALELVFEDNKPRFESMKEYCLQVGIGYDEFMGTVARMPKLY